MAVLTDEKRKALWEEFMRQLSTRREPLGALIKAELRDAVNAMDDWINANSASFNTAIPQPARGALTAKQKAELFMFVIRGRFDVA